ncbi:hypothetical protein VTN02DRAFT_2453 [Thermoascus thermophilus]
MEVADTGEPAPVGPPAGADSAVAIDNQTLLVDESLMDDGRSSSLSELDVSEHEPSDMDEPLKPETATAEVDSEAETERIEDSPHNVRKRNIVVSAGYGTSPSKLAQSTTYDDIEDDADESPSKTRRSSKNNGFTALDDSAISESAGKKRKRLESGDDTGTEAGEDEPLRKRRGSAKSDVAEEALDEAPLSPEPTEDVSKHNEVSHEGTPAVEEAQDLDVPPAPVRGKKGKKGKRKGKKVKEADEEMEVGGAVEAGTEGAADDHLPEDEEPAEGAEEVDDAEAIAKLEEESAKKMSAMDSLAVLEREFATLRDKIYDERIAKLNHELEQLTGPTPTHPEFLRQLESVRQYRDAKIKYEHTLFQYRLKALMNKSLAERAQAHSTHFQRIRDVREKHSSAVSKQFYAIQHDRFKSEEISPHHYIPFPTRRSQQIAQQTAYNQEVSIMSGVAKYVGFPAAPTLSGARPSEIEEDLEKMGISTETKSSHPHGLGLPRGTMSAMHSTMPRTAAEEAFLEQTPWANPQHPIHQQQSQQRQQQGRMSEQSRASAFTTPAAQKRVVNINAPNGSASTIPETSSAANTPYEQDQRGNGQSGHYDYDAADRKSGFRSLSSSPLDVRKPHPHSSSALDHRSYLPTPNDMRTDPGSRNIGYSPPSARLGLFNPTSKREPSPSLPPKPLNAMHQPGGITAGTSSNRMVAR